MRERLFRAIGRSDDLVDKPDYALVGTVRIPEMESSPARAIGRRILWALLALLVCSLVVFIDRHGYRDADGTPLTYLDALYYSAVTLSTTGYGDITPISESARAINIAFVTPLRVLFLIVLIGTTLEVLTERSRQAIKIQNWRNRVRNHTVVIGYGTKGRTATAAVIADGGRPGEIVVVDDDPAALERAAADGLVTVRGDATKSDVLRLAGVQHAAAIVIAANRDDTAVMVTLTSEVASSITPAVNRGANT